ncbi:hypothetical protein SAMN04488543_2693 [Friedmanniella luteola]|uniref:Uncharacterized protein n=1 Tax=Friedmanniella luteola TaxID=546871 RepID=A0A1H1WDN1_9ACTN|nr:hypothetical protein [Friedmanniella luteola]SDS94476.1 hypothetical protein SAMN04488543_2693 [Friedmanniella luteola]
MAEPDHFRRDAVTRLAPPRVPSTGVAAEIKPHNTVGIRNGLNQLRSSRAPVRLLITYRTVSPATPDRFEVLLADPDQVRTALNPRSRQMPPTTWYRIGSFREPKVQTQIPLSSCAPRLGVTVEPGVRATYQRFMRRGSAPGLTLGWKDPNAPGHDIQHEELAAFLQELAGELASGPARQP